MTLDEAIKEYENLAKYHADSYSNGKRHYTNKIMAENFSQLAEWLRELKTFREGSDLNEYSSRLWKNAYNRGWQDALSRAEDESYDIIIDGEVFRCIQVETLIGLGMSRETEPYRNHIR